MVHRGRGVGRWIQLVLVLGLGLGVVLPVLVAVAWVRFAGGRWGWVPSLLVFAAAGFGIGWLAVSRSWGSTRRVLALVLSVLAGSVGLAVAHFAPPTAGRLRHEIEALELPGWRLDSESVDGSALCLDYCTAVDRTYSIAAGGDAELDRLRAHLAAHGLTRVVPEIDPTRWARQGGDVDLSVQVVSEAGAATILHISASATGG